MGDGEPEAADATEESKGGALIRVEAPVEKTCPACPAQWEAKTDDGKSVYVRYRHGGLRIDVDGETKFMWQHPSDGWDGVMSFAKLKALTEGVFSWPADDTTKW